MYCFLAVTTMQIKMSVRWGPTRVGMPSVRICLELTNATASRATKNWANLKFVLVSRAFYHFTEVIEAMCFARKQTE